VIWAEIPIETVIHTFYLSELQQLADGNPLVARLLRLHLFISHSRVSTLAQYLQKDDVVLNSDTAEALGSVAQFFGLAKAEATCTHIAEFVAYCISGWYLSDPPLTDLHLSKLSSIFATAMGSMSSIHHHQDVMVRAAFIDGVKRGMENIKKYTKMES
jgi:hypothetical protein